MLNAKCYLLTFSAMVVGDVRLICTCTGIAESRKGLAREWRGRWERGDAERGSAGTAGAASSYIVGSQ